MPNLERDIARYRNGEMTPAEMHAFEKRALLDPFLGEALEGLGTLTPETVDTDLELLQQKLSQKVKSKAAKVVPFWVWPARIAAGLLVVIVATLLIVSVASDTQPETLAVNKNAAPIPEEQKQVESTTPPPRVDTSQDAVVAVPSGETPKTTEAKTPLEEPRPTTIEKEQDAAVDQLDLEERSAATPAAQAAEVAPGPPAELRDEEIVEAEKKPQLAAIAKAPEDDAQAAPKKSEVNAFSVRTRDAKQKAAAGAAAESTMKDDVPKPKTITGTVKDSDGVGIPGVNVLIKGSNIGTVTDANGHYQISLDRQPATLVYSFIGYTDTEVDAKSQEQIDVQLDTDVNQLSEVVVVGYGASGQDKEDVSNFEFAAPSGGQRAFKSYLENNLRYPERALTNKVEGKVTIQFTVEPTGQLSDFNIVRGLGHGCDEEVIRLVKEGPTWTPSMRNNESVRDKVKVRLKFTLPEK